MTTTHGGMDEEGEAPYDTVFLQQEEPVDHYTMVGSRAKEENPIPKRPKYMLHRTLDFER
jgi:hypothetical protein